MRRQENREYGGNLGPNVRGFTLSGQRPSNMTASVPSSPCPDMLRYANLGTNSYSSSGIGARLESPPGVHMLASTSRARCHLCMLAHGARMLSHMHLTDNRWTHPGGLKREALRHQLLQDTFVDFDLTLIFALPHFAPHQRLQPLGPCHCRWRVVCAMCDTGTKPLHGITIAHSQARTHHGDNAQMNLPHLISVTPQLLAPVPSRRRIRATVLIPGQTLK